MADIIPPNDLYKYIKHEDERVLCTYGNTARALRQEGLHGYLIPACSGGVFLCMTGLLSSGLFAFSGAMAGVLSFLGMMLIATGVLFYAVFLRRAGSAVSTALYITTEAVVYISGSSYMRLELSYITAVSCRRPQRLRRVPFDMSALEGEVLLIEYKGAETPLLYIDDAAGACARISALLS